MLDLLVLMKKKDLIIKKRKHQLYHCKSIIKDVKTFLRICVLWFHFCRFLHVVLVVQGQRERRAGESKNPPQTQQIGVGGDKSCHLLGVVGSNTNVSRPSSSAFVWSSAQ